MQSQPKAKISNQNSKKKEEKKSELKRTQRELWNIQISESKAKIPFVLQIHYEFVFE